MKAPHHLCKGAWFKEVKRGSRMGVFSKVLSSLQKLGQSLMIPVSVLPAAGLVVALGRALQNTEKASLTYNLGQICYSGGLAIFEQLPVIFAVGVAIGFTGGAGVAGLAAAAGYFTLVNLLKVLTEIRGLELAINTGVFGGIAVGAMAAYLYNRFSKTQLNPVLGFFSGKRLVPILTIFATLFLSLIFGFAWPPIQSGINEFGHWVMSSEFSGAFYAAGKRLLIPVGLHHVYYPPFLYQFGEFTTASGQVVHGDSARYFAGDPKAGIFMAAEFPIMLFGLPAAALAMVMRALPSRRKAIAGVMLTAALTSIITGITEPIEFAFIFVAPLLYVLHVALAFVAGFLTQFFDIHLGYTFSASLIDFILGFFNQKNSQYLWFVVGPIMALLYFVGFYGLIGIFDFKTPGRQISDDDEPQPGTDSAAASSGSLAARVLSALGGSDNISNLEACITRLRVIVKNAKNVDQNALKKMGAAGIFHDGSRNFQIVFGTQSDHLKDQIKGLMKDSASSGVLILSPLKGKVISLSEVPDKTFSQKILGEGIAIDPSEGVVYAPFDGSVLQMFRTHHAIGLQGPNGIELLIHVGIDTVKMNGDGFKPLVKNGDTFRAGDRLLEFDLAKIKIAAPSAITPIVITNSSDFKSVTAVAGSEKNISKGDGLIRLILRG